ncbi:hypothetical protein BXK49_10525 [Salmonella enterica subsp. enterica serovar Enteritidis]|nr:hypothetical protein [Salmonella enterica subsp. enterica serovar Enteritidis]
MFVINVMHTSMGFRIEVPVRVIELAILKFAEDNLHAPKMGRDHGRITVEKGDAYYVHVPSMNWFYFHKDYFHRIKQIVLNTAIEYNKQVEVKEHTYQRGEPYKCEFDNYGFQMEVTDPESRFYYQNEVVEKALDPLYLQIIFAIQTGRGKCHAHGTPVRVPGGWKNIEDIRVGDLVTGRDGKPTKVIGVFPQGKVDMYQVTFFDGRTTVACGEHLWSSYYVNTAEARRWGVRNTLEMKRLISMPNPRVYIPLAEPEQTSEKEFLVNPYVLGVLLGDGGLTGHSVVYHKHDIEIKERVLECLPEGYTIRDSSYREGLTKTLLSNKSNCEVKEGLKALQLWGCPAWEKFIPPEYFEGSIEQRWELVRGLMDTDGTVNKDGGQPSFCSTSKELALGVQDLIRSLGGIAYLSERKPKYSYKGQMLEGRTAYNVFIRHKTPSMLFNLPRKKELCRDNGQYNDILKLRVKSIEPVGKNYGTCIAVDNADSLYVVENYIVTHNTKSAQKVMVKRGVRTVLIHRPTYVAKWKFDCIDDETGLRVDEKHVYVAQGTQGIYDLIEDGRSGKLDRMGIKVVILPTVSLFNFMKEAIATMASSPVNFESFYDDIGAGQVVYDEVHEHFLLVYLSGILLNPPYSLEMSATLKPGAAKKFIADRYLERFPMRFRVSVPYIPVVDIRGLYYSIDDPSFIRRVGRMSPYNHKLFEQQLIKHKLEDSYFSMVFDIMKRSFLDKYEPGQKALVFFSLVEMCVAFTKYVKHRLRNGDGPSGLTVAKYNAGDSYDEFIAADIGVSTPGKAGTAIDIPGLVVAIVTIAIDDRQLNEQIAGRPREVTKWDLTPKVFFLHCSEMPKHLQYLASRQESLKEVVKSFLTSFSPYVIRKTHASSSFSGSAPTAVSRFKSIKPSRKGFTGLPGRRGRRR